MVELTFWIPAFAGMTGREVNWISYAIEFGGNFFEHPVFERMKRGDPDEHAEINPQPEKEVSP